MTLLPDDCLGFEGKCESDCRQNKDAWRNKRDNLADAYVRQNLRKRRGHDKAITKEMVEAERVRLMRLRMARRQKVARSLP